MSVRDDFLFPNRSKEIKHGVALRHCMDLSAGVAAQPIGWHLAVSEFRFGAAIFIFDDPLDDHDNPFGWVDPRSHV
jgi:hypothetical protein